MSHEIRIRQPAPLERVPLLLLKPEDASRAMGMSPRALHELTKKCQVPFIKLGKLIRYSPEAIRSWAAAGSAMKKP